MSDARFQNCLASPFFLLAGCLASLLLPVIRMSVIVAEVKLF